MPGEAAHTRDLRLERRLRALFALDPCPEVPTVTHRRENPDLSDRRPGRNEGWPHPRAEHMVRGCADQSD